ncbi:MAG: prolyl oligopeptidase family serine peptidase [Planctomycetota bacterium]|nr:prolyl oligopeptidase family serine peptidase [Planctomycetota bacterium]
MSCEVCNGGRPDNVGQLSAKTAHGARALGRVLAAACTLGPIAFDAAAQRLVYPETRTVDVVDDYFGTKVADPYRWLESADGKDYTPELNAWIEAQNKVTFEYLNSITQRDAIRSRLTTLWNYEKFGIPFKEGGRYFYSYNTGLQNQSVLFVTDALDAQARVLLDPNTLRADGTAALAGLSISDDGKRMAYAIAEAGSDWNTWKIRDVGTGEDISDELKWVKFSGASWLKDGSGVIYSRYDAPPPGAPLSGANFDQKMYLHRVGTDQDKDVLLYARADNKDWGLGGGVTEDGRYLVVTATQGTDPKNRFFYRDLTTHGFDYAPTDVDNQIRDLERQIREVKDAAAASVDEIEKLNLPSEEFKARRAQVEALAADKLQTLGSARATLVKANGNGRDGFVELLTEKDASYDFVDNDGTRFIFETDNNAPRGRVIAIDVTKPERENWIELVPQAEETLQGVGLVNNMLVCSYLKDAKTQVKIFDLSGNFIREVQFPGIGTASGFGGKRTDRETFYAFNSYTTPPRIYRYDMQTGESTLYKAPEVDFKSDDYETVQRTYTSKDGTRVPMFITHRKGITLDGNNPTLLYGYGGFNISLTPSFSPAVAVWLEMGGVYAVANLRGGGEYGEEWHQAGTKLRKQNVFDDFIAAAEFLVAEKYTSPAKLGIQGGSNGGLLVGAVVNQRPELFGAALPAVGVMDMLRFHLFTIGWAWKSDYGSSENPEEFQALHAYSPYHNIKKGTKYPAVLVTTADHDDRVVPYHSFKYAAALQAAQAGDAPVLIRIETRAGHGAGKPTGKRIEEAADVFGFLYKNLGMGKQ